MNEVGATVPPDTRELEVTVSAPEVVALAHQRRAAGLDYWVDGTMGILRGTGQTVVIAPNGPRLARHVIPGHVAGAQLASRLTRSVVDPWLRIQGLPSDVDHASGGPMYRDPISGAVLMVYHGEWFRDGDDQDYYAFLGLAVSHDEGASFDDLGPIVTSELDRDDADRPRPVDVGPGAVDVRGGYLYVYFQDRGNGETRRNLSVARTPLSDLCSLTSAGGAPDFWKFSGTGFDQPGLGGQSAELSHPDRGWIAWFDSMRLPALGLLALVYSTPMANINGVPQWNHALIVSSDGLVWSDPIQLLPAYEPAEMLYVTLDSGGPDQRVSASGSFDLYRTRATTAFRWEDARVERLRIEVRPRYGDAARAGLARSVVHGAGKFHERRT